MPNIDVQTLVPWLAFVFTFVVPIIIPVGLYLYHLVLSKMDAQKRAEIEGLVSTAVRAVEKSMAGQAGPDKRNEALWLINEALRTQKLAGYKYAAPYWVSVLLEASVQALDAGKAVSGSGSGSSVAALPAPAVLAPAQVDKVQAVPCGACPYLAAAEAVPAKDAAKDEGNKKDAPAVADTSKEIAANAPRVD